MEDLVVRSAGNAAAKDIAATITTADLQKSLRRPRSLLSFTLNVVTAALTMLALAPLFSVVYMLVVKGFHKLNLAAFTSLPPAALEEGGGFGNALLGTLIMVGIAALISVPFGIMAALYLAEVGPQTKLSQVVRFGAKVLSGFPSVLAGVVAYGVVMIVKRRWPDVAGFSALSGGAALALLMTPTIILTAEDAIRMVPNRIREAAIGMGATRTQTILHVMLPTALPGILTGVMLAVARAAGETAPLLFTALFSNFWPVYEGRPALMQPTASLAVLIYNFSGSPFENQIEMAWAAALVLVFLVLTLNLIGQSFSRQIT